MTPRLPFIALLTIASVCPVARTVGQEQKSSNTWAIAEGESPAAATIEDLSWIAGAWRGEAMGGKFEESWSKPTGGTMMGMFKHFTGDGVTFYELLTIVPKDGSLVLRLKHFSKELKGWEEKEEVVEKRLVSVSNKRACFEGLTFHKIGPQDMSIYVLVSDEGGKAQEIQFRCLKGPVKEETSELKDGIYLVHRWSIDKSELEPLLPGEVVASQPEYEESQNRFVTLKPNEGLQFLKLQSAVPSKKDTDGRMALDVQFKPGTSLRLEVLTRKNLGRQVAVVFDGQVLTTHKIRSVIKNGKFMISRCTDNACEIILKNLNE